MPEPPDRGPAAFVAEFFGTFALVFFITMVVSLYVTPPVNGQQPFIDFSVIGLVHVFVLFMLVQTLAVELFPPAYTGWPAVKSEKQIRSLEGTRVAFEGTSNKPLQTAQKAGGARASAAARSHF